MKIKMLLFILAIVISACKRSEKKEVTTTDYVLLKKEILQQIPAPNAASKIDIMEELSKRYSLDNVNEAIHRMVLDSILKFEKVECKCDVLQIGDGFQTIELIWLNQ